MLTYLTTLIWTRTPRLKNPVSNGRSDMKSIVLSMTLCIIGLMCIGYNPADIKHRHTYGPQNPGSEAVVDRARKSRVYLG